ncbi:MAG: tRNA (guanosine(37)-N1)-methyltransferase TrmD [bacterium]|nr:tRNA (guanosine(37)-N1)-methyltransferase TrmD [bacterium]
MQIDIFTIFPKMFESPFDWGTIRIAKSKKIVSINVWDLRNFTNDIHRKVDDYPYGGSSGMVLKAEPILKAVRSVMTPDARVVLLTPAGKLYNQSLAQELSEESHLIFICGRYQGVDERVKDIINMEYPDKTMMELSIGNYVLSGGELACMSIVESITRLIPGVLKNPESMFADSLGELDPPLYTKPAEVEGVKVPEILTSGHHTKINQWNSTNRKQWTH